MEDKNALGTLINKMRWQIGRPETKADKLAEITMMAEQLRDSILEEDRASVQDRRNAAALTEIIVASRHRSEGSQASEGHVAEALADLESKLKKKNGYTGKTGTQQED